MDLIETLPLPQRLSLAYAPALSRPLFLAWFALDCRLAQLVRQKREPMLAQLRISWWRDMLAKPVADRPAGDEVLDMLALWEGQEASLAALVDAWELLILDQYDMPVVLEFSRLRSEPAKGLCRLLALDRAADGAYHAARQWGLGDLASNLGQADERAITLDAADALGQARHKLPRALRSLAVLEALANRSLASGGRPFISGAGSIFCAMRVGMFGR